MNKSTNISWMPLFVVASSLSVDVPLSTIPPQAQNTCSGLVSTGQKMGNVDPLTLTVTDQEAYQKIVNVIYQDAMGLVMMVAVGLMVLGIILTLTLKDIKKQNKQNQL